jgi:hypothetical protein
MAPGAPVQSLAVLAGLGLGNLPDLAGVKLEIWEF